MGLILYLQMQGEQLLSAGITLTLWTISDTYNVVISLKKYFQLVNLTNKISDFHKFYKKIFLTFMNFSNPTLI